jgi:3-oxoacyl-(acyl-carrier-protein) synthase
VVVTRVFVHGCGAVSPAGWGIAPLRDALNGAVTVPLKPLARPGWEKPLRVRQVPAPEPRPAFFAHGRLRRASPITQYVVAAALEALGGDAPAVAQGTLRLGIVSCVMSGCVNYSRRFYDETLRDPSTASPLVFPETVFNAPASHLAALLGAAGLNYTIVGDPGAFLQGIALAAQWLLADEVDGCLVAGAEECDWLTADAFRLFSRSLALSDGAGALYLKLAPGSPLGVELDTITNAHVFTRRQSRAQAARQLRNELPACSETQMLVDGLQGVRRFDHDEAAAWADWTGARLSPKLALGEGLMAAAAWQCIAAVDALQQDRYSASSVSVVGCNQQAIGAHFIKTRNPA